MVCCCCCCTVVWIPLIKQQLYYLSSDLVVTFTVINPLAGLAYIADKNENKTKCENKRKRTRWSILIIIDVEECNLWLNDHLELLVRSRFSRLQDWTWKRKPLEHPSFGGLKQQTSWNITTWVSLIGCQMSALVTTDDDNRHFFFFFHVHWE